MLQAPSQTVTLPMTARAATGPRTRVLRQNRPPGTPLVQALVQALVPVPVPVPVLVPGLVVAPQGVTTDPEPSTSEPLFRGQSALRQPLPRPARQTTCCLAWTSPLPVRRASRPGPVASVPSVMRYVSCGCVAVCGCVRDCTKLNGYARPLC